jgi:uncharacterized protein YbaR (Trm112 family)
MEEVTAAGEPIEYLESLLEILACPQDHSLPLSAVRNAGGEVVALRSRESRPTGCWLSCRLLSMRICPVVAACDLEGDAA